MIAYLHGLGLRSDVAYGAAGASILLSIVAFNRAKKKANRAEGERWGIFVGLWAPTFMEIGNALKIEEDT